ncbi:hypothetical protein V8C42DRAFT_234386 [Trichoderma barbatum]
MTAGILIVTAATRARTHDSNLCHCSQSFDVSLQVVLRMLRRSRHLGPCRGDLASLGRARNTRNQKQPSQHPAAARSFRPLAETWRAKGKDEREKRTSHILACAGTGARCYISIYVVAVAHAPRIACKMLVLSQHTVSALRYTTTTAHLQASGSLSARSLEARLLVLSCIRADDLASTVPVRVRVWRMLSCFRDLARGRPCLAVASSRTKEVCLRLTCTWYQRHGLKVLSVPCEVIVQSAYFGWTMLNRRFHRGTLRRWDQEKDRAVKGRRKSQTEQLGRMATH